MTATLTPTERKLKISQVLDQRDDAESYVETEEKRANWLEKYRSATGWEQLSAPARRSNVQDSAPYTDFESLFRTGREH